MIVRSIKKIIKAAIKFKDFSRKQMQVFTWWQDSSPYKDFNGIVADGSIRSGKTVSMALSFVFWAMKSFDGCNFIMSGKSVGSFRRNVWFWLKTVLILHGYEIEEVRTENLIYIAKGSRVNYFYIFGGRDESSKDLVQGITAAGAFFDEVALMPQSFVNQATGRCSVEGAKLWFNCNPENPKHWFRTEWILLAIEKKLLHLHFNMDDNLSLSESVKERYKSTYSGVFFDRYILGLWVVAEGAVYRSSWSEANLFGDELQKYFTDNLYRLRRYIWIDYGTINPMVFLDVYDDGQTLFVTKEYYYDSKKTGVQLDNSQYADELESFISGGPPPDAIVIDPSAASFKAELRNRHLRAKVAIDTIDADNEVLAGIRHVSTLLHKNLLRFHREKCKKTIEEMENYRWDEKALANTSKEKPLKVDDHGPDACRYGCKTLIRERRVVNA